MAQIIYRVTGRENGKRISLTFRNTDEGRESASAAVKRLGNATTAYDVRTRIGGRVVTRTFKRRKDPMPTLLWSKPTGCVGSPSTQDGPRSR